jgi:hypothetical protein
MVSGMLQEVASKPKTSPRFYRWFFVAPVIYLIDGVSSLTNGPLNFAHHSPEHGRGSLTMALAFAALGVYFSRRYFSLDYVGRARRPGS